MLSLAAVAKRNPHGVALVGPEGTTSFAKLFDMSETIADAAGLGRERASAVAFAAKNDERTIALIFALLERGIAMLPVQPRLSALEQARLVECAQARWIELPQGSSDNVIVGAARRCGGGETRSNGNFAPRNLQLLVATSGSSGTPKLVRLSHRALEAAARSAALHFGMTSRDRWLLSLSLAHIGGFSILTRCLVAEAAVVIAEPGQPAGELGLLIEQASVTLASFVPTQLERLLNVTPLPRASSLRAILVGGAPTPSRLLRRARAAGLPALLTYGLSEMGSQVTTQPLADLCLGFTREDAGVALFGIEFKIDQGIICVRGEPLFDGYLPDTGAVVDAEGWFRTSDLGDITETGRLVALGRIDDCVVTGGEKVAAAEVEGVLLEQPMVASAVVVALPDDEWGQIVAAALVLDGRAVWPTCLESIEGALAVRLAAFKRPKCWLRLQEMPILPNGKLDRSAIRARFTEGIGFYPKAR